MPWEMWECGFDAPLPKGDVWFREELLQQGGLCSSWVQSRGIWIFLESPGPLVLTARSVLE